MKLLARILGIALAVAATVTACGAAATLALGSEPLSAGGAAVTSCAVSSLSATREVSNAGTVTQVDVGGIPAACAGGTLSITLVGTAGAALGSAQGTLTGCSTSCSATFSGFGSAISASSVQGYSFAVTGP